MATKAIKVKLYSQKAEELSTIELDKNVFGVEPNEQVMFDAVMTYLSNRRQGTAKIKKRHEVSGGGKKPFRQKGTGRARAGSSRSPIWVGGGTVFGPDGNQNYSIKQNKKEHTLALKSALSSKVESLIVLKDLEVKSKTKEMVEVLKAFHVDNEKVLLISCKDEVYQCARNLGNVIIRDCKNISVYDLLNASKIIITEPSINEITEALK